MPNVETVAAPPRSTTSPPALSQRVQSLRLPKSSPAGGSSWFPWVLVVLLAAGFVYSAAGGAIPFMPKWFGQAKSTYVPRSVKSAAAKSSEKNDTESTTQSANGAAKPAAGKVVLESKGYVIPEQQILVSPQVSARIIELNFEAGQNVEKGFVLAVLDDTEYKAEVARATADFEAARQRMIESKEGSRPDEIKQAQAELAEAETQLDLAKRVLNRRRELYEQKFIQKQELEDGESAYEALVKRVDRLKASVQLVLDGPRVERKRIAEAEMQRAEAEMTRAKWRLDNTIIRAPITGTILKKNAELGNLVNPVAFNGSFSLCDIADLSKLEVELSIQERDVAKVFQNQKCRVRSEAYPERAYDGVVSRLMPIADRAKGAVPVRVRLTVPADEQGMYLKPEMGATVTFYSEDVKGQVPSVKGPVPDKDTVGSPPRSPTSSSGT